MDYIAFLWKANKFRTIKTQMFWSLCHFLLRWWRTVWLQQNSFYGSIWQMKKCFININLTERFWWNLQNHLYRLWGLLLGYYKSPSAWTQSLSQTLVINPIRKFLFLRFLSIFTLTNPLIPSDLSWHYGINYIFKCTCNVRRKELWYMDLDITG